LDLIRCIITIFPYSNIRTIIPSLGCSSLPIKPHIIRYSAPSPASPVYQVLDSLHLAFSLLLPVFCSVLLVSSGQQLIFWDSRSERWFRSFSYRLTASLFRCFGCDFGLPFFPRCNIAGFVICVLSHSYPTFHSASLHAPPPPHPLNYRSSLFSGGTPILVDISPIRFLLPSGKKCTFRLLPYPHSLHV